MPARRSPGPFRVPTLVLSILPILGLGSRGAFAQDAPAAGAPVAASPSMDAALATLERHAVRIHFTFQRDLEAEAKGATAVDPDAWTEQLRRWRMTWRTTGWVVKDRRTVVSSDTFIAPGTIKSIEIRTLSGAKVPVRTWEFLPSAKLCVFRTATDLDTEPVPFPAGVDEARAPLVAGNVTEGVSGLETWAEALPTMRRRTGDLSRPHGFDYARSPDAGLGGARLTGRVDLVVRPDGAAVGFRIGSPFDLDPAAWAGGPVLADLEHSVPIAGLAERAKVLHDDSFVHEVRFTYRHQEDASEEDFGFGAAPFGRTDEPSEDARVYGIAIAPDLLLVPQSIPDAWVKRIEQVTVEDEGDPVVAATYEGRVAGTGAFVVKLSSAAFDAAPAEPVAAPAAGHAFLVHRVSKSAGARRDVVTYDRSVGMQIGYGDRTYLTSEQPVPAGAFLLDLDGRVFGVATELRPEDAERTTSARYRAREGFGTIASLFAENGGPVEWTKALDRRVLPQKLEEARRLPWLGVEYVALRGADVADALELSQPTRDGSRGFLVNVVYADSPAAKAGIQVDDVLLSVRRTSGPGADAPPTDLRDGTDEFGSHAPFSSSDDAGAPWTSRRNVLVKLLEAYGIGTTYELELWRAGAAKTLALTVEQSPRDVGSALKAKDSLTGLTVKELTYEVRHALHLAANAPGVLVADVEEGMAAFQARIGVNELVREMDGEPVADPTAFTKRLVDIRAGGRASVRLVVQRLDKTRFVDVRLSGGESPPCTPKAPPAPAPKSPVK